MTHELKILPQYYEEVKAGNKNFELRKNDRDYMEHDTVILKAWENGQYLDKEPLKREIAYILMDCPEYGLQDGFCIIGFRTKQEPNTGRWKKMVSVYDMIEGKYRMIPYTYKDEELDNPPFSIVSKICKVYQATGIKFFLFAPYLTNFNSQGVGLCHIVTDASITYENGAIINTAFITNLDDKYEIRSAPELAQAILDADKANKQTKALPKYVYPPNVLTATTIGKYGKYGIDFRVRSGECRFIRRLESQKSERKTIFGGGYLISDKAAADKAAAVEAIEWPLSESERLAIEKLNRAALNSARSAKAESEG